MTTSTAIPFKLESKIKSMSEEQLEKYYFDMCDLRETSKVELTRNIAQMVVNYVQKYYVV